MCVFVVAGVGRVTEGEDDGAPPPPSIQTAVGGAWPTNHLTPSQTRLEKLWEGCPLQMNCSWRLLLKCCSPAQNKKTLRRFVVVLLHPQEKKNIYIVLLFHFLTKHQNLTEIRG